MKLHEQRILDLLSGLEDSADLELETVDGRRLVSDLTFPRAEVLGYAKSKHLDFAMVGGAPRIEGSKWNRLHFRSCDFSGLSIHRCVVEGCVFERCRGIRFGLWDSTIRDSHFRKGTFSDAIFGGVDIDGPKPNKFDHVHFDRIDLRDSTHSCELYEWCSFVDCKLDNVDFDCSRFNHCSFKGPMKGVRFRGDANYRGVEANQLTGCDFRAAKLKWCQFLLLDVDPSFLPQDSELLVLPRGPADWNEWLGRFRGAADEGRRLAISTLRDMSGTPTVTDISLLRALAGEEDVNAMIEIAHRSMKR